METEQSLIAPTSIVLIAIAWILIGTFIISISSAILSASYYYSQLGIIPLLIGVGFIMVGWGLLACRKWAFYSALIFSLFGLLISTFSLMSMVSQLISYGMHGFGIETYLSQAFPLLFFLGFAAMFGFLIKNKSYFEKKTGGPP
jgi:ABC-type Na+ efflux pump permease subunit